MEYLLGLVFAHFLDNFLEELPEVIPVLHPLSVFTAHNYLFQLYKDVIFGALLDDLLAQEVVVQPKVDFH